MEFPLACGRGDLKTMWAMLEKEPSIVHKTGLAGWTPLFYAARANEILAVKLLLIFGADPSIKDTTGQVVLDIAKRKKYNVIVKLIENKYNAVSGHNIEFSLACGRGDLVQMGRMMEQDATLVHQVGLAGWTPLFYAARANEVLAVKLLLISGADTSVCDTMGQTALDIAKRKGYDEIIKLIENIGELLSQQHKRHY
jgi:serine/threonine-protein phosphatase 6 regulatory ankyrin repeat subunit B